MTKTIQQFQQLEQLKRKIGQLQSYIVAVDSKANITTDKTPEEDIAEMINEIISEANNLK